MLTYEKINPNKLIFRVVYFFNGVPEEACQEEYYSIKEAIEKLPNLLRESIEQVTQVALYTSNENRDLLQYIDSVDREILAEREN